MLANGGKASGWPTTTPQRERPTIIPLGYTYYGSNIQIFFSLTLSTDFCTPSDSSMTRDVARNHSSEKAASPANKRGKIAKTSKPKSQLISPIASLSPSREIPLHRRRPPCNSSNIPSEIHIPSCRAKTNHMGTCYSRH